MTTFGHRGEDDCDRRVKLFAVRYDLLLRLINQAGRRPAEDLFLIPDCFDLSDGFRVLNVFSDDYRRSFVFSVCHPTWPVTVTDSAMIHPIEPLQLEWSMVTMRRIHPAPPSTPLR